MKCTQYTSSYTRSFRACLVTCLWFALIPPHRSQGRSTKKNILAVPATVIMCAPTCVLQVQVYRHALGCWILHRKKFLRMRRCHYKTVTSFVAPTLHSTEPARPTTTSYPHAYVITAPYLQLPGSRTHCRPPEPPQHSRCPPLPPTTTTWPARRCRRAPRHAAAAASRYRCGYCPSRR